MSINVTNVNEVIRTLLTVKMTVRRWGGAKTSGTLASEIAQSKGASDDSVGAVIYYLDPALDAKIGSAKHALESVLRRMTLPWEDGGWRVLMAEKYLDVLAQIEAPKREYERVASEVLGQYDAIKIEAQRRLNGLYVESDFPTPDEVARKFSVDILTRPITNSDDVRIVGCSDAALEMVRQSVNSDVMLRVQSAVQDIGSMLRTMVDSFDSKLERAGKGERVVWGKLKSSAKETCEALRSLNITNDPVVGELITHTQRVIDQWAAPSATSGWMKKAAKTEVNNLQLALAKAFA